MNTTSVVYEKKMSMIESDVDKIMRALRDTGKYNIAFVGDSLTSCEWVHPNWREIVEYVLKEELQKKFEDWRIPSWGIRCFNLGFDGATTKDILEKLPMVKYLNPDLVITMIGGNDPILGISVEEHGENMKKISDILGGIIATDTKPDNEMAAKKYEPYVNRVVKDNLKGFVNIFEKFEPETRFFTFKSEENPDEGIKKGDRDYWHPNQLGNGYIAKIFLKEIFGIEFDPEKYIKTTLQGNKYPEY